MGEQHYVCKGTCGATSHGPATCQADNCTHKDKPFAACDCDNPESHKEAAKRDIQ